MAITLIATGGTIASTRGADGSVSATLSGADLLAKLDVAGSGGTPADGTGRDGAPAVEVVDLSVPGSWNLSTALACTIADTARDALEGGAEGVVVTHGTDVLEETAWLAELLVRRATDRGGLVFTAAMRHADEFGGDGPRNLADALVVAAHPASRGRGSLVCLNGEIHHSRWVSKRHATALCTFESPTRGPVGEVTEHGTWFFADSPAMMPEPARASDGTTVVGGPVPILGSHWDFDPDLVGWLLERGTAGLVVEGGGAGNVNAGLAEGVRKALELGLPVVVTTRCAAGQVQPIYGGKGGFATLSAAGAIASRGLSSGKARLALQVALGVDPDRDAVAAFFDSLDEIGATPEGGQTDVG